MFDAHHRSTCRSTLLLRGLAESCPSAPQPSLGMRLSESAQESSRGQERGRSALRAAPRGASSANAGPIGASYRRHPTAHLAGTSGKCRQCGRLIAFMGGLAPDVIVRRTRLSSLMLGRTCCGEPKGTEDSLPSAGRVDLFLCRSHRCVCEAERGCIHGRASSGRWIRLCRVDGGVPAGSDVSTVLASQSALRQRIPFHDHGRGPDRPRRQSIRCCACSLHSTWLAACWAAYVTMRSSRARARRGYPSHSVTSYP